MVSKNVFLLMVSASIAAQTARPREHFDHATVSYNWVKNSRGEKLRVFVTRPIDVAAKLADRTGKFPVIFFVGWLSCDSMEYPDAQTTDGFGILLRRLINESGYATVRMDKPGVGESEGDCSKADFDSEMSGWQAAFEAMGKYDFIDRDQIFVVSLSNGGGFSPIVSRDHPVYAATSHAVHGGGRGMSTCSNSNGAGSLPQANRQQK